MNGPNARLAILAAISVALAAAGCDTTQPESAPTQTASLTVTAKAIVDINDCWQVWVDTDDNGQPDFDSGQVWCQPVTEETKQNRSVPWRFSIQISLLKSGQTTEELIASSVEPGDSVADFVSMTAYDETPDQIGAGRAPEPPLYFRKPGDFNSTNGVRVSNGSRTYLGYNGFDLGVPNLLDQTPEQCTYNFTVNPGDTVIVKGRKQAVADSPSYLPTDQDPELKIFGVLKIAGTQVQVSGTSISPDADKTGFSFSYTRH